MHDRNRSERNYRDRDGNRRQSGDRHYHGNRDYNKDREPDGNRTPREAQNYNGQNNQGRNPRIDKWVTEKVVINKYSVDGRHPLRLNAIIERPQFANGDLGFCRLMTTITMGDYHIRLPIKSLRTLMEWFESEKEVIMDGVQETFELNEEYNSNPQPRREQSRPYRREMRSNGPPRRTRANNRD